MSDTEKPDSSDRGLTEKPSHDTTAMEEQSTEYPPNIPSKDSEEIELVLESSHDSNDTDVDVVSTSECTEQNTEDPLHIDYTPRTHTEHVINTPVERLNLDSTNPKVVNEATQSSVQSTFTPEDDVTGHVPEASMTEFQYATESSLVPESLSDSGSVGPSIVSYGNAHVNYTVQYSTARVTDNEPTTNELPYQDTASSTYNYQPSLLVASVNEDNTSNVVAPDDLLRFKTPNSATTYSYRQPLASVQADFPPSNFVGNHSYYHREYGSQSSELPPISTFRKSNTNTVDTTGYFCPTDTKRGNAQMSYDDQNVQMLQGNNYANDILGYMPDFSDLYQESANSLWQNEQEQANLAHQAFQVNSNASEITTNGGPSQQLGFNLELDTILSNRESFHQSSAPPNYHGAFYSSFNSGNFWSGGHDPNQGAHQVPAIFNHQTNPSAYHQQQELPRDYSKPGCSSGMQLLPTTSASYQYPTSYATKTQTTTQAQVHPVKLTARNVRNEYGFPPNVVFPGPNQQFGSSFNGQSQVLANNVPSATFVPQTLSPGESYQRSETRITTGHQERDGVSVLKRLLGSPSTTITLTRYPYSTVSSTNQNSTTIVKSSLPALIPKQESTDQRAPPNTAYWKKKHFPNEDNAEYGPRHFPCHSNAPQFNSSESTQNVIPTRIVEQIEQMKRQNSVRDMLNYQRYFSNYQMIPQLRSLPQSNIPVRIGNGLPPPYCIKWSVLNSKCAMESRPEGTESNSSTASNLEMESVLEPRPEELHQTTMMTTNNQALIPISYLTTYLPPFKQGKVNAKEHRPRHYEFLRLEIGSFSVDSSALSHPKVTNKVKVLFSRRRFVYEFELAIPKVMSDGSISIGRALFCIHVPFITIEAISCRDNVLRIMLNRQPEMYFGIRNPRQGFGSQSMYDTSKHVDVTCDQLDKTPVHKVILKKNQAEKMSSYLCHFDERFVRLLSIPILEPVPPRPLPFLSAYEVDSFVTLPKIPSANNQSIEATESFRSSAILSSTQAKTSQSVLKRSHESNENCSEAAPKTSMPIATVKRQKSVPVPGTNIPVTESELEPLRKIPETKIAGIVKLPNDFNADASILTDRPSSQSPVDLTLQLEEDNDSETDFCNCRLSCRSLRCPCGTSKKSCNPSCSCSHCDNPLGILEALGVKVEDAMNDKCLVSNIYKITHLDFYLNRTLRIGCCARVARYLDCIPGLKTCSNCQATLAYSWCKGVVCVESRFKRHHCEGCNKCVFPEFNEKCSCEQEKQDTATSDPVDQNE